VYARSVQVWSVEFEYPLQYHAVTVSEDWVLCAADSPNPDYGDGSVMLLQFDKFSLTGRSAVLIRDHLTNTPSVLRVMHGGLQVAGQRCRPFRATFQHISDRN